MVIKKKLWTRECRKHKREIDIELWIDARARRTVTLSCVPLFVLLSFGDGKHLRNPVYVFRTTVGGRWWPRIGTAPSPARWKLIFLSPFSGELKDETKAVGILSEWILCPGKNSTCLYTRLERRSKRRKMCMWFCRNVSTAWLATNMVPEAVWWFVAVLNSL